MEEHGKVIFISQTRSGISPRNGQPWASLDFVIEVDGRYMRRVAFGLFGADRIAAANLMLGEYITVKAEVEAHEHEGRWFNEIRAYAIIKNGINVLTQQNAQMQGNYNNYPAQGQYAAPIQGAQYQPAQTQPQQAYPQQGQQPQVGYQNQGQ